MMKKARVAVVGAAGRMGQELLSCMKKDKSWSASLAIENSEKSKGFEASAPLAKADFSGVDLVIDFSSPKSAIFAARLAMRCGKPFLSGTTGLLSSEMAQLKKTAQKIPILWSSNMSLGVMAIREALPIMTKLKDFSFQIEEIHHAKKKDKPSGTALLLQSDLKKLTGLGTIPILSERAGEVVGVHKVWALSDEELICFEHQALSRSVFAKGALRAGRWLMEQSPGFYTLQDFLNDPACV